MLTAAAGHGGEVVFVAADMRYESEVERLVEQAVSRFGRLDVMVNNAGVDGEAFQPGMLLARARRSATRCRAPSRRPSGEAP